jgi:hypothetical protein
MFSESVKESDKVGRKATQSGSARFGSSAKGLQQFVVDAAEAAV